MLNLSNKKSMMFCRVSRIRHKAILPVDAWICCKVQGGFENHKGNHEQGDMAKDLNPVVTYVEGMNIHKSPAMLCENHWIPWLLTHTASHFILRRIHGLSPYLAASGNSTSHDVVSLDSQDDIGWYWQPLVN